MNLNVKKICLINNNNIFNNYRNKQNSKINIFKRKNKFNNNYMKKIKNINLKYKIFIMIKN